MKIVYHHRTLRKGVEGVHISGVINGLRRLGHEVVEVSLASPRSMPQTHDNTNRSVGRPPGNKSFYTIIADYFPELLFRVAEICYNFVALFKLHRTLWTHPDADFIYDRYAYFCFAAVLMGKIHNKPVITEVNIVTNLRDTRELKFAPLCRFIEQWILKNSSRIFVVSKKLKEVLTARAIPEEKIVVQPNGCDLEQPMVDVTSVLGEHNFIKLRNKTVICFLGRLLPWYKLDSFIELFADIRDEYPPLMLVLIGDGPERQKLEEVVSRRRLNDAVIFTGNLTHLAAMSTVSACDLCVLPATNDWTSPVKLFEYMGMGKAVIAPNIDSVASVMIDNKHGRLFRDGDFEDLKEKLVSMIADKAQLQIMGDQGREHIKNHFTWVHVAQNIVAAAQTLL